MPLSPRSRLVNSALATCLITSVAACAPSNADKRSFPDPNMDVPAQPGDDTRTAVLAGGCFWGVEAVFEHVKGVEDVVSGFAAGAAENAQYQQVGSSKTQHAEAVRIVYDPAKVTYGQLLKIFFSVAHDPTQLNRQGPDVGPQYRSAVFIANPDEQRAVEAYIEQITDAEIYRKPIVTEVAPLQGFHAAGSNHQNFAARNPNHPYIVINDAPKIARLKREWPEYYRER